MYDTASPTVLRFCTSLSGILTPNFSSAATTTSTMDSESTSRSSVKDFCSATSSGFTPATSSRISARPDVISARVAMLMISSRWWGIARGQAPPSGAADDLTGVGEAAAEAEQQHRGARGHLAPLDQLGQGQRHARRGGVAGFHDVPGYNDVGAEAEPLDDAVDDPGVRLVRHECGQLLRPYARLGARLAGERREGGGGPAEDDLPFLLDVRLPALDAQDVALVRRRAPQHRADAGLLAVRDTGDHSRARTVAEEHGGAAVGPVGDVGQLLGADHHGVAGGAGPDRVVGGAERVREARTRG